ncbi:AarF/UbiB family protein [Thermomonas sp.]|uniref:ABC1 kinase family protein n=1 Tax=Thermomonas sp. TaxID=1971895 RepID=UPI002488F278|nr:AarF/UbiB family protein [Thermomonas sp.]MDI1253976.1 AarF/UbiB family protein [Thermomonas sp.]
MFWETLSTARDLGRLHEVASVLARYGFGDMVGRLGMTHVLERAGKIVPIERLNELVALPPPERVRRALEEMGPSFVKLGQVLATRVDLFAPEWIAEFEKLQNRVPALPFEQVREQLEADLGAPPDQVFAAFDPEPLAAASIAQVYRARLHDGAEVVVKVRRPNIKPLVEADMRLLHRLASIIEAESPDLARYQPRALVRQLQSSLTLEMDLAAECRHAERIAASFVDEPALVVPTVYWQWTGERVNVQQFIDGIPLSDLDALDAVGGDRTRIARLGAQVEMKMMFLDGFFHADPHPGNVFWLPGDRLALIDFGMVGHLSEARRQQMVDLFDGMVRRDSEPVAEVLLDWSVDDRVDADAVTQQVEEFIDHYHGVPLKELHLGTMMGEITALLREHQVALPPDLALMVKVLVTLEGMGSRLDPEFDMASEAAPVLQRVMLARYSPRALARRGRRAVSDSLGLLASLPSELKHLLRMARRGRMNVNLDVERLEKFGQRVEHSANRLVVGVVIAALIVGSSIVMTVSGGPTLLGLPVFGLFGFLGAVLGSFWLLFSIWRSGGGR